MSITTMFKELPTNVEKQIIRSLVGSLNATAINYTRGFLRKDAMMNAQAHDDGIPSIDKYNDAMAENDATINSNNFAKDSGGIQQEQLESLIYKVMVIRNYFSESLREMVSVKKKNSPLDLFNNPYDKALSINETLAFQLNRQVDANPDRLKLLADATGINYELLHASNVKIINDDYSDLKLNAGNIRTYLENLEVGIHKKPSRTNTDIEVNEDIEIFENFNDKFVDEQFDSLPAHVQYKIVCAVERAHNKATASAVMSLLKKGNMDAAGDIKLIEGSRNDLLLWLKTFARSHAQALNDYIDRGGELPPINEQTIAA